VAGPGGGVAAAGGPGSSDPLAAALPQATGPQGPVGLRAFGDVDATRRLIYDETLQAVRDLPGWEDDRYRLVLADVDWADPERFTRADRKRAVLTGETLARRMRGTWELYDKKTGRLLERRRQVVAAVPYLTSLGTFVYRGTEYTVNHQQRLRPGVFTRVRDNGDLEGHVNVLPGQGVSHRYFLDPAAGLFKIRVGQAEMPLVPLLRALGATDREMRAAWGDRLWQVNAAADDGLATLRKLARRLLPPADRPAAETAEAGDLRRRLAARMAAMPLDPQVTRRTLGRPYDHIDKDVVLATTAKLLRVGRGEAEPDDRDHLAYQQFLGPEDLFAERIRRDHGRLQAGLFREVAKAGTLKKVRSGALTAQLEHVLVGSGLAQALEEINPAEVFDKQTRVTRMGEGGIAAVEAIPDEARAVQPSHLGFLDPVRTPESFRVGVDLHASRAARKGRDGRLYTLVRDRAGRLVWKSAQDLADAAVATPEVLTDPFWRSTARVPVMRDGRLDYVRRSEIDYVIPDFGSVFSPLANLVPLASATKPGRLAMGARYITQALPLVAAEAPLVRSGVAGSTTHSYEDEYAPRVGAVRAAKAGRVVRVGPDGLAVKYDDGTSETIELYRNYPFNRKTYIHQEPVVRPGDVFRAGQLLARSNYTDPQGTTALGVNLRVAYMPYKGLNFEDAVVVSESAARRLTSEHMYQFGVEPTPRHKLGRAAYVSLFPGKYPRSVLEKMDERGVVRVGETVEFGQPLILAAQEQEQSAARVHRRRQPSYHDVSQVWEYHDPGVVTDVVWGRRGPVVLVKSASPARVGDKLSGRYGDKGVISAVVPDDRMPRDREGRPFEMLLSPDGVITRTNPSQVLEAALGKVAAKTGRPVVVPDFAGIDDLEEWVERQLRRHGLSSTEDVVWPDKNAVVRNVGTGYRFVMKLHHTAECFDRHTDVLTARGWLPWPLVRDDDALATVRNGRLVFERPLRVVRQPFCGRLWCYDGPELDYAVTPDHRLYVRTDSGGPCGFVTAAAAHGRRFFVPRCGFPQAVPAGAAGPPVAGLAEADYAELVGWWAVAGSVDGPVLRFCGPDAVTAAVAAAAGRAGLRACPDDAGGLAVEAPGLADHLRPCDGPAALRRLPRRLMALPPEALRRAYGVLTAGPGGAGQTPAEDRPGRPQACYLAGGRGLADDFQELCVRLGLGAVVRRPPGGVGPWSCEVVTDPDAACGPGGPAGGFSLRPYDGVVYCAEVSTGLLYVRRNGRPMWSGNSKGQARDTGAYSVDETPAKGGATGCFVGDTELVVCPGEEDGPAAGGSFGPRPVPIRELVETRFSGRVFSARLPRERSRPVAFARGRVTDWFHYRVPPGRLVTVELEDGSSFSCTDNHLLVLKDRRLVPAGRLRPGDELLEA